MKRLYIGGLGHRVSEKDLKDRFGKFGDVSDVEIITRKDENGAPLKTFGYININITDAEYKRCVGILNKSTWKGGTLLIQLAKESFLHKLAEERQQLVEKAKAPKIIPQEKLVDSFKVAGIENFHMKAAVPGTDIPGHKNWVVSKFGRVLPVVNLKCKGKNNVFKYDPSKHCHNIKRLETADDITSVSKLTWEIKGGDDEISKKRRGEFPKQKPCPKRSKIDLSLFLSNLAQRNEINAAATGNKNKVAIQQNGLSAVKTGKQKSVCVFDNDSDSEDEIRMLVAQEHLRNPKQTSTEDDNDNNLEVVGDDFVVKYNVFWGGMEQDDVKTSLLTSSKDDEEYDSADTDEILTRRKTQTQVESAPVTQDSPTESSKNKSSTESDDGSDEAYDDDDDVSVDSSRSSSSDSSSEESENSEEEDNAKVLTSKTSLATQLARTIPKTVSSNNSIKPKQTKTSRSSSSDSSSEESESSEEEDNAKVLTSKTSLATQLARTIPKTVSSNNSIKPKQTKTSRSSSSDSSSEESETSDDEKSRTQTKDSKPANSKNVQENVVSHQTVLHSTVIDAKKQQQDNKKRLAALEQRQKETEQQRKLIQGALSNVDAVKANKSKHIVFDSDDDEEEDETTSRPEQPPTILKKSLFEYDSGSNEDQLMSMLKEKKDIKPGGSKLFDSEDEDDGSEDDRFQIKPQFEGKAGQKLMKLQARFGTDSRFQVDSRFLESDDEFEDQDEAAPEKDADKQLLEEKKKSLDILQSILNTNIQPQNSRKGTMFKDVSSLHYDPTQEEHAAFEAKTEEPKKESKAARRKKRIEAEKLPEVSKDVYFDISVDLKEVFGTSKENQDEKETVSWDKETEDTEDIMKHMEVSFTSNVEAKEDASGGFKFSFFGEDTAAETTTKTDEYKIETVKGAKFSWQADPRFQDSSSDEEGVDEVEEDQSASSKITEEPTSSKNTFFFFYQNDERLKEGPGMFCRSVKLQDQREAWEQKRTSLREECRKKHRDAKRRQRPSLKT
ncbi:nucleolar protein 8-like [Sinocyclocheilus grahami]|uniref:nucleolar protein 8-like n=1 Tax=Sinocyclocheilus grahami TaxID=75366 RepID=UPI0007ACE3F6|nr:PREDICTED: nucleolar protein 8-like [Sinocyclocheilus grahami]